MEEFISGKFNKYTNNNGDLFAEESDIIGQKAECLSHFSYEKSEKKLLLVDVQGSGYDFFDPEIASDNLYDSITNEILYCTGNLSKMAIKNFIQKHNCNKYCEIVGLKPLKLGILNGNHGWRLKQFLF